MIIEVDALAHYGTKRHSGRYPWGSGGNETTDSARDFLGIVDELRAQGMTEVEIGKYFNIKTSELRAKKTIALNEKRNEDQHTAAKLRDKGMSVAAISRQMGIPDSTVRALLKPSESAKLSILQSTAETLRAGVADKTLLDVGAGNEIYMGISREKLSSALSLLKEEGYGLYYVNVDQLGTGLQTKMKVLAPPGMPYAEVYRNRDKISFLGEYSEDGGKTYTKIHYPTSISSKRLGVRYADEGGSTADGVVYVRRGVDDISLGSSNYAQVRIAVDGSHYIKGMAMYKDDMPPGVDLLFNTSKHDTGNKLDALKKLDDDPDLPMGAVIRRQHGVMNIVNEEGQWDTWSANFSSQMLSKQSPSLIKSQLNLTYEQRKAEYDEIMSLTNPVVKQHLLESFADGADSAAVHLKAASFPRTRSQVILPIDSLKDTEIYAPNFRDGEQVVLVRHPHGGIFEIPTLTVNNSNKVGQSIIGKTAADAIGINSKVAEHLSGADFDGDTVLVIPDNRGRINAIPALEKLKGFNPREAYPYHDGMPVMSEAHKQREMGIATNLVADMTIRGASFEEIARAVRYSMVVIDAAKHKLNYRQAAIDNGISALKAKYQPEGGASTLISRSRSEVRIPQVKARTAGKGGPVDVATGRKMYEPTNKGYTDANGVFHPKLMTVEKLSVTDDAHTLSSGTHIENLYADYSNRVKALANQARKASISTTTVPASPSAKVHYAAQVASLNAKLNIALKNAPLERQAQVIGNAIVRLKMAENPNMSKETLKKIKRQALAEARARTGANKVNIEITKDEWEAIQAGAISNSKLKEILQHADLEIVRTLATPRQHLMTSSKINRAQAMLASGYTQAQVADALGVSLTTLKVELNKSS